MIKYSHVPIILSSSKGPSKKQAWRSGSLNKNQLDSDRHSDPGSATYFGVILGKLLIFLNFDFLIYKIGISAHLT